MPTQISAPVVVGRALLVAFALGAFVAGIVLGRVGDRFANEAKARYVCPMHPEVTASAPGTCPICRMALERVRSASIVSEMAGAAAQSSGDPMAAPALPATLSLQTENLLRYGISLARRHVFPQEIYAPASLEAQGLVSAQLYKDEVIALTPGEHGQFFLASAPTRGFAVRALAEPASAWDSATARVHFQLTARDAPSRAGLVGWVKLEHEKREALVVPSSAVLPSPEGPYLLVLSAEQRTVSQRRVEVGKTLTGFTAIVSGLSDRELVVGTNAFFVDAERRVRQNRGDMR